MSASSRPLESFTEHPIISPNSGHLHNPRPDPERPGKWTCDCEAGKKGATCVPMVLLWLEQERAKTGYLQEIHGWTQDACQTFEEVAELCFEGDEFNEREWIEQVIVRIGGRQETFTADDIYRAVGGSFIRDPRLLGSVIGTWSRAKILVRVGYEGSERNASRPIFRWKLNHEEKP